MGGTATVDSLRADRQAGAGMDFNFLEEEFQVQLALAISASDPDTRQDPETAQIDAAKRISLGCSPSDTDTNALVEFLSLRYWVRTDRIFHFNLLELRFGALNI